VENTDFFLKVVAFAKKHNLIVCSDNAYSEITFDGYRAPSFLEVPGAKEVGVEFHSFSKTYNMAGWRLGFVVGNAEILATLEKFKSFLDYGVFTAIQLSGVKALTSAGEDVEKLVEVYRRRRDRVVEGLNKIGWVAKRPKATFYLWLPLPPGFEQMGSLEFAELLLQETGIVVAPGIGFGSYGEGYIRMALVTHDQRFHDLLLRLKKFIRKRSKKSGR
jgi:LL-diaminopimelate aminotransferase